MKKLLAFLPLILLWQSASAEQTRTVFNPFTGKLDYITAMTTNTIVPGSGVTVTCTSGACTVNSTGGGGGSSTLAVTQGTVQITSPTASINFNTNDFLLSAVNVSTAQVYLNPSTTDFIWNTNALQTGSTSYVGYANVYNKQVDPGAGKDPLSLRLIRDHTFNRNCIGFDTDNTPSTAEFCYATGAANFMWGSVGNAPGPGFTQYAAMNSSNFNISGLSLTGTTALFSGPDQSTFTYGVFVGSITGSGLATCGDSSHALSWTSGTNLFGCQAISTSGGASSTLAVGTGTLSGWSGTITSSPTSVVLLDQSQFSTTLQGGATAFITIQAGVSSVSGNFTIGSTSTVVLANCSSACTVTLPTAVGVTGRVFSVKRTSTAAVTIATTSSQTIDGATTQVLVQQYTSVDMISDGANWSLL